MLLRSQKNDMYKLRRVELAFSFQSSFPCIAQRVSWRRACLPSCAPLLSLERVSGKLHCPWSDVRLYYSTNCNTIQIWSWYSRYLSSVGNRYPAIYVASLRVKCYNCTVWNKVLILDVSYYKDLGCFVINLLNNKTIILLNLAEYRLILANSAYGLVG